MDCMGLQGKEGAHRADVRGAGNHVKTPCGTCLVGDHCYFYFFYFSIKFMGVTGSQGHIGFRYTLL